MQDSSEARTLAAPVAPSVRWDLSPWALLLAATVWAVFQATAAASGGGAAAAAAAAAVAATCRQIGVRGCWNGFHSQEAISWAEGRVLSPHRLVGGEVVSWAAAAAALELAAAEGTVG